MLPGLFQLQTVRKASMKRVAFILLCLATIPACTSQPSTPAAPKTQPTELLTGRVAFQQMYIAAHGWGPDARPYQLKSGAIGDNRGHNGKAALWNASFASASMHASKTYNWSGIDSPDAPARGINPGTQDSFTPNNTFDLRFLKTDSDSAFDVAQQHGGEKLLQEKPATPVIYLLDWNAAENNLVWHVIYGNSRSDAALVVDVDASTGKFQRKEQ
jgi:hypothetical protein